jgi:YegS/Rv2252/BmrU family lipid kinase
MHPPLNLWPHAPRPHIIPSLKSQRPGRTGEDAPAGLRHGVKEVVSVMPHGSVRIIVNPISGRGHDHRFLSELSRHLALRGFSVDLRRTERAGHAGELAQTAPDDARCLVSVGGDGTHREVLSGIMGRPVPVCIVPSGTENILARTFRLGPSLEATLRRIQAGRWVDLDMGIANGRPFAIMSGVGFDAAVTEAVHARRHGRIAREAYFVHIGQLLWKYPFPAMHVTVDGRPLADNAGFVLVANLPLYADGMRIAAKAVGDDGLLDVVCYRTRSPWQILRLWILTRQGKHIGHPMVAYAQGRRIEVTSPEIPSPAQVDGDPGLTTPVTYTIVPKAVRLLVQP